MTLRVLEYDSEFDRIVFVTDDPHDETDEIVDRNGHVLDYDSATYKPTSFELLLCASVYIPLSPEHGYDPATDTLTFGGRAAKSAFATENGDLVAHWGYDELDPEPDFYVPFAVVLRNASKHLASVRIST